jgi:thiol-disulfide isomerase/thioredoxin
VTNPARRWRPAARRPAGDRALASLAEATRWLNSAPLSAADLRGRVVLVDFWTYTCINWLRTLPYLRTWREKYEHHGLVVLGVHTPEFDFEHDLGNVARAVEATGVHYPVAVDNDYAIWNAFGNHYWPALYLVDGRGKVRHHHYGEGGYAESEEAVQRLLGAGQNQDLVRAEGTGVEAAADWESLWSPENYLGSERTENFASPNGVLRDTHHRYAVPDRLRLNHWALGGGWTVGRHAVELNGAGGSIAYRFHARDVHLVMAAPAGSTVRFRVRLDREPPGAAHGLDVGEDGNGTLTEPRLYQLIRQPGPIAEHSVEITFLDPGVRAYAFTFG